MRPIRRILVAVKDPSAPRLPAVAKATQLARCLDAELELFHVLDSQVYLDLLGTPGSPVAGCEDERRQTLQRLKDVADRMRLQGVSFSVSCEWDQRTHKAIVRRSIVSGADLIVAEAHAGRHIAPGIRKLTDWELLRLSSLPVLLVKDPRPYHRPTILAAVDPMRAYAKPAGLDEEILGVATTVSNAVGGILHAVHACEPVPASLATLHAAVISRVHRGEQERARLGLERLLKLSTIPAGRRHVMDGEPSEVLQQAAHRLASDIVVLGAMSRSGLERLLVGNTAERLLDRLACDLLIVKPPGFACGSAPSSPSTSAIGAVS